MIHSDVWTTKAAPNEVFSHFKAFKAMVEKEKGMQIKVLRFDEGGEYFSEEFNDYFERARNSEKIIMQIYPSIEWGCRKEE